MARRKRKKSKKKKKRSKKKKKQSWFASLRPETRRGVAVVILLALGLLSVLALYGQAGRFGVFFTRAAEWLFGNATLLVPIAFFVVAGIILRYIHEHVYTSAVIGTVVLLLAVLGLLHLFFPESSQGGVLGSAVAEPLEYALGFWASFVVMVTALAVAVLTAFNIPLRSVKMESSDDTDVPLAENEAAAQRGDANGGGGIIGWFRRLFRRSADVAPFTARPVNDGDDDNDDDDDTDTAANESVLVGSEKGDDDAQQDDTTPVDRPRRTQPYTAPSIELLGRDVGKPSTGDLKANATIIQRTLKNFNIEVEMGEVNVGPTVTQYTLRPATGVKLSKITALQKDLALALAAHPIRIEAPIPGRSLVGIEVPNTSASMVRLGALLDDKSFKEARRRFHLPLTLGRDVAGNPLWSDLATMPHMLVAGATGSGKSVCINSLLVTLLYQFSPDELRLILVDPKRVELPFYNGIPHLLSPVIVESDKVTNALRWAIEEMEDRYEVLAEIGARDIHSYNNQIDRRSRDPLPYIVIVIDELADIMASYGREVEGAIVRLAQMARAVGIHLIVSTQRPSVEVITGLIKANITSRIAFQVASQVDSRTILDQAGAEKLLGNGDMLFLSGESSQPRRVQGAFLDEKEVKKVVGAIRVEEDAIDYEDDVTESPPDEAPGVEDLEDERYGEAKQLVLETDQASASFLQRRMKVGYARAARLIDMLEQEGIVGPQRGSKPREILVDYDPDGGQDDET